MVAAVKSPPMIFQCYARQRFFIIKFFFCDRQSHRFNKKSFTQLKPYLKNKECGAPKIGGKQDSVFEDGPTWQRRGESFALYQCKMEIQDTEVFYVFFL